MENFQLYRTNVLLGGQCKWDLILDGVGEGLKISDIHLTPIDKNLPYNYYSEESLLNYPHSENIKRFYKQTEGNFYSCKPLTRLDNDWLILDENDGQVVYDDTYETGAKNSNYQLYSKSLEYLCPVWIEVLKNSDEFIAKLEVWTDSKCIGYKEVNLLEGRFGAYFSNYIEYLDLNTGSDELIKVDLLGKKAYARGVRVDTGAVLDIDISDLTYNLLNRERTLLENDAMLINNYPNNQLIAKQLFNFNFCFNLSDLISKKLENELIGEELRFSVSFLINGKELEMRDFYSNYEYLPITNIGMIQKDTQIHRNSPNALDYLLDNLYVSHITKNKYLQNTCHWSLSSNSQYMFNLYNGLGSYIDNGDGVVKFGHRYMGAPDLISSVYRPASNNIGWVNCINYRNKDISELSRFMYDDQYYNWLQEQSSDFSKRWVNYVDYGHDDEMRFKLSILLVDQDVFNKARETFNGVELMDGEIITTYFIKWRENDENIVYSFLVPSYSDSWINQQVMNSITYKGMIGLLMGHEDEVLKSIHDKLIRAKQVPLISFDKSLYVVKAVSPTNSMLDGQFNVKEIDYYKNDTIPINESYVLRYDGSLKPMFITHDDSKHLNYEYFKITFNQEKYLESEFVKYINSGVQPTYPSIGYCALNRRGVQFDKYNRKIMILKPVICFQLTCTSNENLQQMIISYIMNLYNVGRDKALYIYNQYSIINDYTYSSKNDITTYIYKITMTLK